MPRPFHDCASSKDSWRAARRRLADALELSTELSKELARTYVYASMKSDEDTRVSKYQGMQQEMVQLAAELGAETAYRRAGDPEDRRRRSIERFVAQEPRLKIYRVYLDDIQRRRAHTRTDAEEKLLASASVLASGPSTIYGILSNADFPYPTRHAQRRQERAGSTARRSACTAACRIATIARR